MKRGSGARFGSWTYHPKFGISFGEHAKTYSLLEQTFTGGSDTWETIEVWGDGSKYLPTSSRPGREVHRGGVRSMGDGGMGHLEHQEQILLWRQATPTSRHPAGCYESFAGLPEAGSAHGRTKLNMGTANTLCTWSDSAPSVVYTFFLFSLVLFFQTERLYIGLGYRILKWGSKPNFYINKIPIFTVKKKRKRNYR